MRVFHWSGSEEYETLEVFAFVADHEGIKEACEQVKQRGPYKEFGPKGELLVRPNKTLDPYEITSPQAITVSAG